MSQTISFTSNEGYTYEFIAGTLRRNTAISPDWFILDDTSHAPSNITVGPVTTSHLEIQFPTALRIISLIAAPDDTFARVYQATFGASVSVDKALIKGTVSGEAFNPSTWSSVAANIWIQGLIRTA